MEFRPVVNLVCRSSAAAAAAAAATARPAVLGGTQLLAAVSVSASTSAIRLQRRQFSTNNQQRSEAVAVQRPPPPQQPHPQAQSAMHRVGRLRAMLQTAQQPSAMPPRPPPIRQVNSILENKPRATTKPPPAFNDPYQFPDEITADMNAAMETTTTVWNQGDFLQKYRYLPPPELRLRPSTGRTIQVRGNVDVARGFRLLHKFLVAGNVRRETVLQRAHERPALKRKRLKRERWQQRFKVGFRATINRVMELKAQGW